MEEPIVQNQAVDPQAREAETVLFLVLALSCSPYRLRTLAGRSSPARAPRSVSHHRSLALWHHSRWSHAQTALHLCRAPPRFITTSENPRCDRAISLLEGARISCFCIGTPYCGNCVRALCLIVFSRFLCCACLSWLLVGPFSFLCLCLP
jgi:hypothetical protein